MEKAYIVRPVQAEQFIAAEQKWPAGVTATGDAFMPHVFTNEYGARSPIRDGDYVKRTRNGRVVVPKAEFEELYQ